MDLTKRREQLVADLQKIEAQREQAAQQALRLHGAILLLDEQIKEKEQTPPQSRAERRRQRRMDGPSDGLPAPRD